MLLPPPPQPPLDHLPAAFLLSSEGPRHPKHVGSGASAPGRGARGWKREGKCKPQLGESSVPPRKRNPRSCLPSNSKETRPPSPFSGKHCLAPGRRQFLRLHCSAGCLQTCPCARAVPQVQVPGQVLTGTSELSGGAAGAAASSFRGGRIPSQGCSPRVPAPTPRSAPKPWHLQTQTPDECLKITMLPCQPLSSFLMHVGGQPMRHSATLPAGAHWLGGQAGGGLAGSPAASFA